VVILCGTTLYELVQETVVWQGNVHWHQAREFVVANICIPRCGQLKLDNEFVIANTRGTRSGT
jgi:hypothetical protein